MIYDTLTDREKDVLHYVMYGLSNAEIGRILYLSEGRINTVVMNLYEKYLLDTQPKRVKLVLERFKELGIDYKKMPPAKAVF